jgi:hypothetical protein
MPSRMSDDKLLRSGWHGWLAHPCSDLPSFHPYIIRIASSFKKFPNA